MMSFHPPTTSSVRTTGIRTPKAFLAMPAPSRQLHMTGANAFPAGQTSNAITAGDVCAPPRGQEPGINRRPGRAGMAEDSPTRRTVLIAGAANLFVGAIKLVAGILVGSSAMLAEAAHSAADTLNQAFLLASLHRGERPADSRHPFGYGQEPIMNVSCLPLAVRDRPGREAL